MSPALRPWPSLTPAEQVEAVRPLEADGHAASTIAWKLKAPKTAISRICAELRRETTELPDPESTGAADGQPSIPSSDAAAAKMETGPLAPGRAGPAPGHDAGKSEQAVTKSQANPEEAGAGGRATINRAWTLLSPAQKADLVRPLVKAGASYATIVQKLGAPSRSAIAGVVTRMKQAGETVPSGISRRGFASPGHPGKPISAKATRKQGGIMGGKPGKALREARKQAFLPQNIANKAESRKNDPLTVTISSAAAWDALDGIEPVTMDQLNNRTCRWPLWNEPDDPRLYCGAECEIEHSYCTAHASLSRGYQPARRIGVPANA